MRLLYRLHIPFVIAFLAFVVGFVLAHARDPRDERGKTEEKP
jgi:hypothetical protein